MLVTIPKVQYGVNEDGVPMFGPATPAPEKYISVLITEDAYLYTVE